MRFWKISNFDLLTVFNKTDLFEDYERAALDYLEPNY